jgi:hypothetical protein
MRARVLVVDDDPNNVVWSQTGCTCVLITSTADALSA